MKCTNCGMEVDGVSSFCPGCKQLITSSNFESNQNVDLSKNQYTDQNNVPYAERTEGQKLNDMLGQLYLQRTIQKKLREQGYYTPANTHRRRSNKSLSLVVVIVIVVALILLSLLFNIRL